MDDRNVPMVVALGDPDADPGALGGKAAALDRLVHLGVPVPPGAVLTTAAYRRAVGQGPLAVHIAALRRRGIPDPARHAAAREATDQAFLNAPLPDDVLAAIAGLGDLARGGTDVHLAVRSSATAEDLAVASFAGQYRSLLDVAPDDVERAVRLTWASLWHPAPRTYRAFHGLGDDVEMAVLAMRMVDPVVAGVLFTRDPAGSADDVRLEWVAGLGESLVSGARTPEVVVRPRAEALDHGPARDPELGPPISELIERALDLENALGHPQDIEWAIDRTWHWWIVQARPITTLAIGDDRHDDPFDDGFDVHPDLGAALTTAGIGEMLPGVLPPLLWDSTSLQVEEGFRTLLAGLGAPLHGLAAPHALVARLRGRAALDLDRMRAAAASIPGGSADELERRYFGDVLTTTPGTDVVRRAGAWQGVRLLLARRRAVVESEIVIEAIDRLHREEPAAGELDDDALLALRARVLDLGVRAAAAEITVAAMAAAAYRGVETFLADRFGDDAPAIALRLTRTTAAQGNLTLPLHELDDATVAALQDAACAGDCGRARARLGASADGRAPLARWDALLARSGSTAVFAGATWAEVPELAWMALYSRTAAPAGHDVPAEEADELLRRAGAPLGPVHRRFLRREVADAIELLARRERTKASWLVLGGVAHRIDTEIGRRLVTRGRLEDADDVRLLTGQEVRSMLAGGGPAPDLVARRRRRLAAAAAAGPLPRLFRGNPADEIVGESADGASDGAHPGLHRGWAASPGRYEGPARVVDSPSSRAIRRGEVLVARATDASWVPLFLAAGAIVVEEGGPLSHAAIIARELGMPAVVNVPGIVDAVTDAGDGAHLAVDGTAGIVRLHRGHPADELPARPPAGPDATAPVVPALTAPRQPDLNRLGVFVTGLIGAGAILSAIVTITEAVGSERGGRRTRRRAAGAGWNVAETVLHGTTAVRHAAVGLHPAHRYAAGGIVALLAAAAAAIGAGHLVESDPDGWDAVWIASVMLGVVPLVALGGLLLHAATTWPDVGPLVRRHLAGVAPSQHPLFWPSVPVRHRRTIAVLGTLVAALLVVVVTAESVLLRVDRPLYEAIDANQDADLWGPDWFGMFFGRPQVVVPAALVVALFTWRCRVLALAYPLAIVFGGLANMGIGFLVGRQRPPLSNHAGQTDSFPSGHAIEVTLLFGLAPLAVAVLLRSRWAGRGARVVASIVLAVMLADGVRDGSHWLSDHVAGFSIALAAVVFVHALASMPVLHHRCRDCPALAVSGRGSEVCPP